jgi:hypothetical protein
VNWLLEHGWHEKALAAVQAGKVREDLLEEVTYNKCFSFC